MKILIYWKALPDYSQGLIKELLKQKIEVNLIIDDQTNCKINNVKKFNLKKIKNFVFLKNNMPDIFLFTGWDNKKINNLAKYFKDNSVKTICMVDNILRKNFKQILAKLIFKKIYDKNVNFYSVPGKSSIKLLKYFGIKNKQIISGHYSASSKFFFSKIKASDRKYQFIFVGKVIRRKGIDILIKNFIKFHKKNPKWKLLIMGDNKLKIFFKSLKKYNIFYKNNVDNKQLINFYNHSRALILPSRLDHWGVVVHEAALCGCPLILSNKVGAASDLFHKNGFIFDINKNYDLNNKLTKFSDLSNIQLNKMSLNSKKNAKKINYRIFINKLKKIKYEK